MKILSHLALSLMELIVASVVVIIILLGIASSQLIFQRNSNYFGSNYFVSAMTDNMLNHILTSASMAIGSGIANDKGILIGLAETGDANTFCIHQDVQKTLGPGVDYPGTVNGDLFTTANHRWLCYTLDSTTHQLTYCDRTYTSGAAKCPPGNGIVLGTALNVGPPSFTNGLFSIAITNCMDPTQSTCGTTSNPSVTKTGSVSPSAHSL
ncbi:MAG: hypothetical protein HY209_06385 [Candidatus Omnitrophica bacterium]|nr:hypothetical protein [Candidatus Omnitrophota bacterium]